MLGKFTHEGDEYETIVGEEEFFAEAVRTQVFCNWAARPTALLAQRFGGQTQREWHGRTRPLTWQ